MQVELCYHSVFRRPITPTGENEMKPNLSSFSQTSLSQSQNLGLDECTGQMHWDAGSSPNLVPLVLRSTIKGREKTCLLFSQGRQIFGA